MSTLSTVILLSTGYYCKFYSIQFYKNNYNTIGLSPYLRHLLRSIQFQVSTFSHHHFCWQPIQHAWLVSIPHDDIFVVPNFVRTAKVVECWNCWSLDHRYNMKWWSLRYRKKLNRWTDTIEKRFCKMRIPRRCHLCGSVAYFWESRYYYSNFNCHHFKICDAKMKWVHTSVSFVQLCHYYIPQSTLVWYHSVAFLAQCSIVCWQ